MNKPKILFVDIETSPLIVQVWDLFDQNVGLNQIQEDWRILSWAAKWSDSDKVMYEDCRHDKDDKKILKGIWALMNEADIIIGQNSTRFDVKKLFARFIMNGLKRPSPFIQFDTLTIAKKHFKFTSNKLEYLSGKLCLKYKKLKHENFSGHELWSECLKGNISAWNTMKKYNIHDVLATEELFWKLQPYESNINFDAFSNELVNTCPCGSKKLRKRGFNYSKVGKYQRLICLSCGTWSSSKKNLLLKEKRDTIRK